MLMGLKVKEAKPKSFLSLCLLLEMVRAVHFRNLGQCVDDCGSFSKMFLWGGVTGVESGVSMMDYF